MFHDIIHAVDLLRAQRVVYLHRGRLHVYTRTSCTWVYCPHTHIFFNSFFSLLLIPDKCWHYGLALVGFSSSNIGQSGITNYSSNSYLIIYRPRIFKHSHVFFKQNLHQKKNITYCRDTIYFFSEMNLNSELYFTPPPPIYILYAF